MQTRLINLGLLAAAFGLGALAGHIATKRRLEMQFHSKLDEELDGARKYYTRLSKRDSYSDPSNLVEPIITEGEIGIENFRMRDEDSTPRLETDDDYSYFNYRQEVPKRDGNIPYVISYDEFMQDTEDYDRQTLTYYSKDDVLVDERDTPIEDYHEYIGPVALDQFGNGSRDPNIVYVRNDKIGMEYEICFDPDSFEATVLGHIKHADKIRRFRLDDD